MAVVIIKSPKKKTTRTVTVRDSSGKSVTYSAPSGSTVDVRGGGQGSTKVVSVDDKRLIGGGTLKVAEGFLETPFGRKVSEASMVSGKGRAEDDPDVQIFNIQEVNKKGQIVKARQIGGSIERGPSPREARLQRFEEEKARSYVPGESRTSADESSAIATPSRFAGVGNLLLRDSSAFDYRARQEEPRVFRDRGQVVIKATDRLIRQQALRIPSGAELSKRFTEQYTGRGYKVPFGYNTAQKFLISDVADTARQEPYYIPATLALNRAGGQIVKNTASGIKNFPVVSKVVKKIEGSSIVAKEIPDENVAFKVVGKQIDDTTVILRKGVLDRQNKQVLIESVARFKNVEKGSRGVEKIVFKNDRARIIAEADVETLIKNLGKQQVSASRGTVKVNKKTYNFESVATTFSKKSDAVQRSFSFQLDNDLGKSSKNVQSISAQILKFNKRGFKGAEFSLRGGDLEFTSVRQVPASRAFNYSPRTTSRLSRQVNEQKTIPTSNVNRITKLVNKKISKSRVPKRASLTERNFVIKTNTLTALSLNTARQQKFISRNNQVINQELNKLNQRSYINQLNFFAYQNVNKQGLATLPGLDTTQKRSYLYKIPTVQITQNKTVPSTISPVVVPPPPTEFFLRIPTFRFATPTSGKIPRQTFKLPKAYTPSLEAVITRRRRNKYKSVKGFGFRGL